MSWRSSRTCLASSLVGTSTGAAGRGVAFGFSRSTLGSANPLVATQARPERLLELGADVGGAVPVDVQHAERTPPVGPRRPPDRIGPSSGAAATDGAEDLAKRGEGQGRTDQEARRQMI